MAESVRVFGERMTTRQSLRRGSAAGKSARFTFPGAHLDIVVEVVCRNIARESRLHTDESNLCWEYALPEFLEGLAARTAMLGAMLVPTALADNRSRFCWHPD